MAKIRFTGTGTPDTPPTGKLYLYIDIADNHMKTIDDTGAIVDITSLNTIIPLATAQEALELSSTTSLSPFVMNDIAGVRPLNIVNEITGLTQTLAIGGSYNLMEDFILVNEDTRPATAYIFKDSGGVVQANFLEVQAPTSDNFYRFAAPEQTYLLPTDKSFVAYLFRLNIDIDIPGLANNETIMLSVNLERVVGTPETLIEVSDFLFEGIRAAEGGHKLTALFFTWVNTDLDPFVDNGVRVVILNSGDSDKAVTVTRSDIDLLIMPCR